MWKTVKHALFILTILLVTVSYVHSVEVHQEYDWWEPSVQTIPPLKGFGSCAACHESLGIAGGAHPTSRKYCEDCHLLGRSGPFVYYQAANLYRNFNYSAPMVSYHIINASDSQVYYKYSFDFVEVPRQSDKAGGGSFSTCFDWNPETGEGVCHGISSENPVDGYFAFNLTKNATREDPYRHTVEAEHLPDTTDCMYCHRQNNTAIVAAWGDPTQVDTTHFDSAENSRCYECHVDSGIEFTTFHTMGPEPEVIYLEPPETTPPPPTTPPPTTLPPPTTQPPTTQPPTTQPPTTQPPTTIPPETTAPPQTTQPPAGTGLPGGTMIYAAIVVIILLIAAAVYIVKTKGRKEQE